MGEEEKNELTIESDALTRDEKIRESQNRIIAIFILYIAAVTVYLVGRSEIGISTFEFLIIIFVVANTVYFGNEIYKLIKIYSEGS